MWGACLNSEEVEFCPSLRCSRAAGNLSGLIWLRLDCRVLVWTPRKWRVIEVTEITYWFSCEEFSQVFGVAELGFDFARI